MKLTLALATLVAVTAGVGCGNHQPAPEPRLKAQLHQTLTGHSEVAWKVAFSPDGRWLASSSYDKTVKLWRLESAATPRPE